MSVDLILLAAGSGRRMQGAVEDKILARLGGRPLWRYSFDAFARTGRFRRCVLVHRDAAQRAAMEAALPAGAFAEVRWAVGGRERADSVRHGLAATAETTTWCAIHDAARPLIAPAAIVRVLAAAEADGGAVLARPVTDTIKRVARAGELSRVALEDLDRARLWAMETPQIFRREWLCAGYAAATEVTDDVAAVAAAGHPVTIVEDSAPNPKLTRAEDLAWLEFLSHRPSV